MQDQQVGGLELQEPTQMATEWISEYLEFKRFLGALLPNPPPTKIKVVSTLCFS